MYINGGYNIMKENDIVIYKGQIGKIVTFDKVFKFKPCSITESCRYSELDTVTDNDVQKATHKEKIEYLKAVFVWGNVINVHCIGEYQIIEAEYYGSVEYYGYIDYNDIHVIYKSLDEALIGIIGIKYDGIGTTAPHYFAKMIGMSR